MTTRLITALAAGFVAIAMSGAVPALMAQDAPQRRGGPERR